MRTKQTRKSIHSIRKKYTRKNNGGGLNDPWSVCDDVQYREERS